MEVEVKMELQVQVEEDSLHYNSAAPCRISFTDGKLVLISAANAARPVPGGGLAPMPDRLGK
jgi:hypothetical protein